MNTTKARTAPEKIDDLAIEKLAKQFESTQDPIIGFFKNNQKIFSYFILAILISGTGYRYYQSAHDASQLESAALLSDVREDYQVLAQQVEDKTIELPALEKAKRSFEGSIKTLDTQKYPYDLLAKNYHTLAETVSGNLPLSDMRKKLDELEWQKSKNSPNALWKELLALNLAKSLLIDENQQEYALTQIKSLAQESQYLRVVSLITWRSFAESKQNLAEEEAAKKAIADFTQSFPEQTDFLK